MNAPARKVATDPMPARPERSIEEIGKRLKALRMAVSGDNQADFCRRLGIATNTWNQYEKGKGRPQLDVAVMLCDSLGVTLDWIYLADPSGLPHRLVIEVEKSRR